MVEFMAIWSEPCESMVNTLADLAAEFPGQFVFAKVDVEEQPELVKQYGVENVPALFAPLLNSGYKATIEWMGMPNRRQSL
ncbi:MAG: thioredoxin domain-containing protein [Sedimenticola sp.]